MFGGLFAKGFPLIRSVYMEKPQFPLYPNGRRQVSLRGHRYLAVVLELGIFGTSEFYSDDAIAIESGEFRLLVF